VDWSSGKAARAVTRLLAILLLSGATASALAANVQFVGNVGYSSDYKAFTIFAIDNVKNFSPTGVSANLRAELWATATPFSGSFSSAYRMATYGIAPLAAGASTGQITATTGFVPPPGGTWYVAMVLTEYTGGAANDGYVLRQYLNFPGTIWFAGSDATPPTVSITSPTGGSVAGTVTVSASASDNVGVSRVDLWINGALALSDNAAPYQFSWDTTKLANGLATLRAVAYDTSGNAGLSSLVTVTIANGTPSDTTPPTVSISSPTSGNVSGTVTVSANAGDNIGVAHVDFYVNGGLVGSDAAAPYQYSWNTTSVANGAAQLKAVAYDAAGNSAQSAIVTVNVANADTTPPTVSITSPSGGNVAGTVTVSATAGDNVGVTHVDFYVNGALAISDSAAPYQYSWNTTSVANGAAQLKAVAYDAAGNSAQSAIVTVTVANVVTPPDTTPPTVSIASPTGGNVSGVVTISVNASDNVGVTHVDLMVNGQSASSATSAPYQFSWNSTGVANGAAQLKAVAFDAAGNLAQSAIVTVNVANAVTQPDTTPPTVPAFLPGGGTVTGLVTLSATASDNVGVSRVDFYANGELVGSGTSAPYHVTWDSRKVPDGAAILMAVAFDAAGNSGASAPAHVTIANNLTPIAPSAYAIEYYNAVLDHYFISASAPDINALDSGQFAGWSRTGYVFKVYLQPTGSASPVCRFYMPPIVGDSHFYSASSVECSEVSARFPLFVLESESVFYVNLPDTVTGACPATTVPVYRVWNNRPDSNHRYMTDPALREQMVAKGYIAEGYGPDIVIMCAPM